MRRGLMTGAARPGTSRMEAVRLWGGSSMPLKTNLTEAEAAWWDRRSDILVQGTELMNEKPDVETWTERERRLWLYAVAIGNRIERLQ